MIAHHSSSILQCRRSSYFFALRERFIDNNRQENTCFLEILAVFYRYSSPSINYTILCTTALYRPFMTKLFNIYGFKKRSTNDNTYRLIITGKYASVVFHLCVVAPRGYSYRDSLIIKGAVLGVGNKNAIVILYSF